MKRILFSHESDIDGIGSVILSKVAFGEIDYELFPNGDELEIKFRSYIDNKLKDYDEIYITDLSLRRPSIDLVNNSDLKNKVKIFDHHQRAIDEGLNDYEFSFIEEIDKNNKKRCATEIFYNYLLENNLINRTDTLDEFCELTRLEDTWGWRSEGDFGVKAHDLAILFSKIGKDNYINNIVDKINNNSLELSPEDKKNIQDKKDEFNTRVNDYINKSIILLDDNNDRYGIVYAPYEYRNEITDRINVDGNKNDISYMVVVALDKGEYGQRSYRKVKDDFDVNKVAMRYGGGGHPGAAGAYITKEQRDKALNMDEESGLKYLSTCIYKK